MKKSGTPFATRARTAAFRLLPRPAKKPIAVAVHKARASFGLDRVLRPDEDQIQITVIAWLRMVLPKALVFHVANERKCTPEQGAYLKKKGVLAGIPDIVIILPEGRCVMMEVKTGDGVMSKEQICIQNYCKTARIPHGVIRSVDDARMALERFGIKTRESNG